MKDIMSIADDVLSSSLITQLIKSQDNDLLPLIRLAAGLFNHGVFPKSDLYTTDDQIVIEAQDGIKLTANVFVPKDIETLAPAVILINSWALTEYQYLTEAAQLAEKGYIVLNYATRGFGKSEGVIATAGPDDISDLSTVIDYLLANYPADPDAIGSGGISYGSGISLIGAAADRRIKAVVAMSSWGSLEEALYGNQSPRIVWGSLLDILGDLLGNPDPIIKDNWNNIRDQNLDAIPAIIEWARERSPITYVEQINNNGTAVYFGKAYGDNLFQPNSLMDMYSQLTVPKHVDLVPGTHATAELLPSLLGLGKNTLWENAYQWFDIHLKNETNTLSKAKPVQMEIKLQDKFDGFDQFPIAEATEKTFYLHQRYLLNGNLESKPYNRMLGWENAIYSIGKAWGFSTQVPLISQILDQNDVPTLASVALASLVRGIYFHTDSLDRVMKIRGNPSVTVQLQPTSREVQLVAYLYDMDTLFNVDKLITHGVITLPDATPGETVTAAFELVTTAYDVPAGHRVALAFDTGDPQYQAPTEKPYRLNFKFSRKTQSVLQLPVL